MKIDYFYDASNVKGTYDPLTSTIGINTANTEKHNNTSSTRIYA